MGAFISVLAVKGCNEDQVREALEKKNKSGGSGWDLVPEECQYKTFDAGTQVLLNDGCYGYEDIPKALSKELKCPVLLCYIYDGDYWGYEFYNNGKVLDSFDPLPEYFDLTEREAAGLSGNSSIIAEYFDVPEESIKNYLVRWADVLDNDEEKKSYDDDEFCIGDDWQMADFLGKIGFPYE